MEREQVLINLHTSTGTTAPSGASLQLGEIAVQHTPNSPALWIKMGSAQTSTEYEKFIGQTEILSIIEETLGEAKILGSGYTYSGIPYVNSATSIADAYSALTNEIFSEMEIIKDSIVDNQDAISAITIGLRVKEYVIAQALNDLNDRIIELSGSTVNHLPVVTENDNGKILKVVNGVWSIVEP